MNGYLHVSHGNFDDSPGQITPLQVKNIGTLAVDIDWTFRGDDGSGLLAECWLSATAHATGGYEDKTHEIGWFPKMSPDAAYWVTTIPTVGTFDSGGVTWTVGEATSGSGPIPYLVAYRAGNEDYTGPLNYHDYFTFLHAQGKITGEEWHNGHGFGVEPHSGRGALDIHTFSPTYTQGAAGWLPQERLTNPDFTDTTGWQGQDAAHVIANGVATYISAPQYSDRFPQRTAYALHVQLHQCVHTWRHFACRGAAYTPVNSE